MTTNCQIALRFLLHKKRAMLMTLGGITFGVAFFILTQAQTSGFEQFFIRTLLATDSALRISDRFQETVGSRTLAATGAHDAIRIETLRKYVEGVEYPGRIKALLAGIPEITGVAEVLRGNAAFVSDFRRWDAQAFGVNLREFRKVTNLDGQIIAGALSDFEKTPNGVLVGSILAQRTNVRPGDVATLTSSGSTQRCVVSGIFETGIGDIDKARVIMHLTAARSLLARPFGASYLQASVADPGRAPAIAGRLQSPLLGHAVSPWQKREKMWLEVFRFLRYSSAITVTTIIVVSALGMFNTLAMLVIEKTKEIAILRSYGFSKRDVTRIFLWLGWMVIMAGAGLGCGLGALLTWATGKIPLRIRGIFSTDHFIVNWDASHYVAAVLTAVVVVFVASYFPARRASRIEPGEIIRGTSS